MGALRVGTDARSDTSWDRNLEPGEILLWTSEKPHSVWVNTYVRNALFTFGCTLVLIWIAPKTSSIATYCAIRESLRCERDFWLSWPFAAICTFTTGFFLRMILVCRRDQQPQRFAITSRRAFATTPWKPDQLRSIELRDKIVRTTFFEKLRFGRLKEGPVFFCGLDEIEIKAAMEAALQAGAKE